MYRFCVLMVCILLSGASALAGLTVHIPDQITFCGEIVPLDNPDVRDRLETQLLIFANQRVTFTLWFRRAQQFFPTIERVLEERKMPMDLKYVAVIESGLQTRARSSQNAVGPWQFLAPTGRERGLSVGDGIDERMHLEKATHAALDYFTHLRTEFGSWSLALAAYNAGQGRIREFIYRQGTSNYYEMILADETERYVFNAISAKLIMENPELYGFDPDILTPFHVHETTNIVVQLDNFVPVKMLAYCAGVNFRAFRQMNMWITGANLERGRHILAIPPDSATVFHDRLRTYFDQLSGFTAFPSSRRVTVKSREGNMRVGPGMEYPVFRTLPHNHVLRVSGRTGVRDNGHYWYIFRQSNDGTGWIWGGELNE